MAEVATVRLDATVFDAEIGQRSGAWFYFFSGIVLAVVTLTAFQAGMWVEPLPFRSTALTPRASMDGFHVDGYVLTADVSSYGDELFAYLMFDYLRTRRATTGVSYLLIVDPKNADNLIVFACAQRKITSQVWRR